MIYCRDFDFRNRAETNLAKSFKLLGDRLAFVVLFFLI